MQDKRELLTIGQASEYLGVSIDTIRRWERKGRIQALRSPGGHRYFEKKDLDNLFGKKYTRDEPTIRRKVIKEDKEESLESVDQNEIKAISEDFNTYNLQPTTDNLVLEKPVRKIEIPPSPPIRIILQEQTFSQTTTFPNAQIQENLGLQKTSILTPPTDTTQTSSAQPPPTQQEYQNTKKWLKVDKVWIIAGSVLIVLLVGFIIIIWQSSQKLLSPVP